MESTRLARPEPNRDFDALVCDTEVQLFTVRGSHGSYGTVEYETETDTEDEGDAHDAFEGLSNYDGLSSLRMLRRRRAGGRAAAPRRGKLSRAVCLIPTVSLVGLMVWMVLSSATPANGVVRAAGGEDLLASRAAAVSASSAILASVDGAQPRLPFPEPRHRGNGSDELSDWIGRDDAAVAAPTAAAAEAADESAAAQPQLSTLPSPAQHDGEGDAGPAAGEDRRDDVAREEDRGGDDDVQ